MRLFAAIELPEPLRARVGRWVDERRPELPRASWVRSEALHLTLVFFGDVEASRVAALAGALRAAAAARPRLASRLAGAGAFPERGPLRVLWLGVEPAAELAELAEALRRAASALGVAFDERPFTSHLTLARCREPWPGALRGRWSELAPPAGGGFEIDAAALLASELGAPGPRYRRVAALPLAEAA